MRNAINTHYSHYTIIQHGMSSQTNNYIQDLSDDRHAGPVLGVDELGDRLGRLQSSDIN